MGLPPTLFGSRVLYAHVHPHVALLEVHRFSGSGHYLGGGVSYVSLDRSTPESPFPPSDLERAAQFYQRFLKAFELSTPVAVAQHPDAQSLLEELSARIDVELQPIATARRSP